MKFNKLGFLLNKIYPKLPVAFQNLAISAFGYLWKERRFGGIFPKALISFKERENYNLEQWTNYQTEELRKILINAYLNVPFYTEKYSNAGFKLSDFE